VNDLRTETVIDSYESFIRELPPIMILQDRAAGPVIGMSMGPVARAPT
jgi:hypothetical protein